MSNGERRLSLTQARGVAEYVVAKLRWGCERIEIAGSVRRAQATVGDVEIVAVPKHRVEQANLFETRRVSVLDEEIGKLGTVLKGGDKYKQIRVLDRYTVDLFIQPDPATWGVNLALRTGSADFSKWLVSSREIGGALPAGMTVREARVWVAGRREPEETPEEADFFGLLGLEWIEPRERSAGRWGVWAQSRQ